MKIDSNKIAEVADRTPTLGTKRKINCVIVDDENQCIRALQGMLNQYTPEVNVLKSYNNGLIFLEEIDSMNLDFVFLDIEMPHIKGYEIAKHCIKRGIPVIFSTAYQEYVLTALRLSASDFLLKPVSKNELKEAIERIKIQITKKDSSKERIDVFTNLLNGSGSETKIVLNTSDSFVVVPVSQVVYCKSDSNYSWYILSDGKKHLVSNTLKSIEQNLKSLGFLRIHQSYLVNVLHIEQVKKVDGGSVCLSNSEVLHISRRNRTMVFDYLLNR